MDSVHIKLRNFSYDEDRAIINVDYQNDMQRLNANFQLHSLFEYWQYLTINKRTLLEGINLNKQLVIENLMCAGQEIINGKRN